ncbi:MULTISPECIES: glycosyltransferase family 2 protein [Gordonia]|uniref:glycosyltransferase family 2 protein n=1 Tax=Gordonia TaxID=2053 RepID=UPI0007E9A7C5|nr:MULTISPECIES: glycosyltransferase family 2 protein [Gordonia]OBA43305.1 hypothetical protein A5766_17325 [Gordonia sp. 852002-51296_SCH5728562-b]
MTISLVIPAYNEEATIAACLDSAVAQQPAFDEILVVDNSSTDSTVAIVGEYVAADHRIRLIVEPRQGVAFARATGFDAARGDIIARIDADTRMAPGWSEAVLDSLRNGTWAAVTGVLMFYDAPLQGALTAAYLWSMRIQGKGDGGELPAVVGASMAIRATAWATVREWVTHHDLPGTHEDQVLSNALRRQDIPMYYNPDMRALTSPRRVLIAPTGNVSLLVAGIKTAIDDRDFGDAAVRVVAAPFNLAFFTLLWLVVRPWDPASGTWSLARFFAPVEQRGSAITR